MNSDNFKPVWDEEDEVNLVNFNWHSPNSQCLGVRQNSFHEEEENNCDSIQDKRQKTPLSADEISDLHQKRKNLIQFIDNIGEIGREPIRKDILSHCQKISYGAYAHVSAEQIIKLAKNRVQKMIKNKRIKKNWSQEDIKILIWIVSKYCQMQGNEFSKESMQQNDWEFIANLIPGVTPKSCMFKWLGLKKNNLADNSWAEEQSNLLNQLVKHCGLDKWGEISQFLYEQNKLPQKIYRCPKQCRQHWNCYLDPKLKKGPWDKQEDYLLLRAVHQLNGAKKWAEIVKLFNGRTQNALKNRYNLIIDKQQKQTKGKKKQSQAIIIENYLKKHQGSVKIQQDKLRIIQDKRNSILQAQKNQLNKKSYKKTPRKKKQVESESEEYEPKQWKQQYRQQVVEQSHNRFDKNSYDESKYQVEVQHHPQVSYENLFRNHRYEEPIFEQDQQHVPVNLGDMQSRILIDEQRHQKPIINYAMHNQQLGTNQQHLNIDLTSVQVVSLDMAAFERLKNRFHEQKHQFVPCKITADNYLIKYNHNDNNKKQ